MEVVGNYENKEDFVTYFDSCTPSPNSSCGRKSSGSDLSDDGKYNSVNATPPKLKCNQENKEYMEKIKQIQSVLSEKPVDSKKLRELAMSEGGLVNDKIRKVAWPELLGLSVDEVFEFSDESELKSHPEYQQVVLDVKRSSKRFPPDMSLEHSLALQDQLILLILRVVTEHPGLRYYQGYHDVGVTLLLVTGLETAYVILERLSTHHLKMCMEPTMEKTSHLLNYIFPLVKHQNEEVYKHLEASGVGNMFALPWFLTWFSHSLNRYEHIVRLFDYFLASEPLSPLYLSAVIIAFRGEEILETNGMPNLHFLLSQIPDELPFEELLVKATDLYREHPPMEIEKEALLRTRREEEQKERDYAVRRRRMNQNLPFLWRMVGYVDPNRRLPIWAFGRPNHVRRNFFRYRHLVATATFALGLYAVYLKTVEAIHLPEKR